jgi:WS/DGAT/MGAT family acyltransferase
MVQRNLSRRFSSQDAAFFYSDTDEAPLNVGFVGIFEGAIPFGRFIESVASKLHLVPRYWQRVVSPPFNIGRPTWEYDPNFDIRRHIHRLRIEPPGTDSQLADLAAGLYAGRLDRGKPLWEVYMVEGLEGNRTGMIAKTHHCLVDGVSGIELLTVTLDVSQDPPPSPPPHEPYEPPPIPDGSTLFFDAIWDNVTEGLGRWANFQKALVDLAMGGDTNSARNVAQALAVAIPYFAVPTAPAPFDGTFSGGRKLACTEVSFPEVRAIRKACGGTVNDIVLAMLGGALGRYQEMHDEPTQGRAMRVLTPVNVRREDERGALGNHIAMLLVEVPVGMSDPVERLRTITERTERLKRAHVADGIESVANLLLSMPAPLGAMLGAAGPPPNTVANIICTNVPGPMIPLYTVGHRMLSGYPMPPPLWGMGINCGVMSYNDKLYFGLVADAQAAPDVERLKEFLDQSYVELKVAAGVDWSEPSETAAVVEERSRRPGAASAALRQTMTVPIQRLT